MEPDIDLIFLANLENQIFLGIFFVKNPDSTNPKENQTQDLPTFDKLTSNWDQSYVFTIGHVTKSTWNRQTIDRDLSQAQLVNMK